MGSDLATERDAGRGDEATSPPGRALADGTDGDPRRAVSDEDLRRKVSHDDGDEEGDHQDDEAAPLSPTARRDQRVRSVIEWVAVLAGAVVVALLVRTFLFTTFWIPSASMEPTLMGAGRRDRVVVNRLSYKLHDVNRGDIIVFKVPPGEASLEIDGQKVEDLIKRVVGLPGETVALRGGDVYVDGEKLDEPYLPDGLETTNICGADPEPEWVVPDDAVFVMGDNRPMSLDARCWSTHSVEESEIVGRAFIRVWPLTEITLL